MEDFKKGDTVTFKDDHGIQFVVREVGTRISCRLIRKNGKHGGRYLFERDILLRLHSKQSR